MHRGFFQFTLFLLFAGALSAAWADIFRYEDHDGHVYLTDKPLVGTGYRLVKRYRIASARPRGGDSLAAMQRRRARLAPLIEAAARAAALEPALVHAVVRAESAYRADAVSRKGARGLMQLMPETARRFGVRDVHDPRQNLAGGTRYLRWLLEQFDGDLRLALAAYNAGENAVLRHGRRIPPYRETRDYVEKVLRFYRDNRGEARLALR